MENDTAQVDNSTAQAETPAEVSVPAQTFNWKSTLRPDLKDSTLAQKFDDSPEGLNKAFESHAGLEKLLGHEKVPVPKDDKDVEGWSRYKKAFGIPEKPDGYKLTDIKLPQALEGQGVDKAKFSEIVHANNLTPKQADSLWKVYNQMGIDNYNKAMAEHQKNLDTSINALRNEWGDAYNVNVELGQTVINKFSDDQETNDFVTATLTQNAKGIKFLAKIGEQFAENKIGEFQLPKFAMSPDMIKEEIQKITSNPDHPYMSKNATQREHDEAVRYVNGLYERLNKGQA